MEWRTLYRMRTLTVHHYDKIRDDVIWAALTENVPETVATLGLPSSPGQAIGRLPAAGVGLPAEPDG